MEVEMKVNTIFTSINGEVCFTHQGGVTTFIRLFGCNLRCSWCDTQYSYKDGDFTELSPIDIAKKINTTCVTITGGEPLLQQETIDLIRLLLAGGHKVSVETNGSIEIPDICRGDRLSWVVDYKLLSSGMSDKMVFFDSNIQMLSDTDFVKFVVGSYEDIEMAKMVIRKAMSWYRRKGILIYPRFVVSPLFSGVESSLSVAKVFAAVVEDLNSLIPDGDIIFNVQLHKLLGVS
jgi:7-carboxy-7-deazaguanine synthase